MMMISANGSTAASGSCGGGVSLISGTLTRGVPVGGAGVHHDDGSESCFQLGHYKHQRSGGTCSLPGSAHQTCSGRGGGGPALLLRPQLQETKPLSPQRSPHPPTRAFVVPSSSSCAAAPFPEHPVPLSTSPLRQNLWGSSGSLISPSARSTRRSLVTIVDEHFPHDSNSGGSQRWPPVSSPSSNRSIPLPVGGGGGGGGGVSPTSSSTSASSISFVGLPGCRMLWGSMPSVPPQKPGQHGPEGSATTQHPSAFPLLVTAKTDDDQQVPRSASALQQRFSVASIVGGDAGDEMGEAVGAGQEDESGGEVNAPQRAPYIPSPPRNISSVGCHVGTSPSSAVMRSDHHLFAQQVRSPTMSTVVEACGGKEAFMRRMHAVYHPTPAIPGL